MYGFAVPVWCCFKYIFNLDKLDYSTSDVSVTTILLKKEKFNQMSRGYFYLESKLSIYLRYIDKTLISSVFVSNNNLFYYFNEMLN